MSPPRIRADSSSYVETTLATAHHNSSNITVPFIVFFAIASTVGVLAVRMLLSRRPGVINRGTHGRGAPSPTLEEPPPLREVWLRPSDDAPQPHVWDTFVPVSAMRIPAEATDAPTVQLPTNHSQAHNIIQAPPVKHGLVQVAVLISMPSERQYGTPSAPHHETLSGIATASDETVTRKCPDVAFGIARVHCTLDDS